MSFQSINISAETVLRFPADERPLSRLEPPNPLLPVLIVLHQETSTPGRVGNALRALGHPLDIRRPRFGDPLPETLDDHAGAVIFGGPMSANDPDDYVRREIDWIAVPLREQRPFLGICLGAQMLARQLGAPGRAASGRPRADRILPDPPHAGGAQRSARTGRIMSTTGTARDFELPAGAELLAEGSDFPVEAFQIGPCFRLPVSSRRDLRDDASLDHARPCAPRIAGRAPAPPSLRRSRGA